MVRLIGRCVLWAGASYGPVRLIGREIWYVTTASSKLLPYPITHPSFMRIVLMCCQDLIILKLWL
jgi:hypothetical protein